MVLMNKMISVQVIAWWGGGGDSLLRHVWQLENVFYSKR